MTDDESRLLECFRSLIYSRKLLCCWQGDTIDNCIWIGNPSCDDRKVLEQVMMRYSILMPSLH